jgi:hypothetical protein
MMCKKIKSLGFGNPDKELLEDFILRWITRGF